jgi:hypothetical protein
MPTISELIGDNISSNDPQFFEAGSEAMNLVQ